MYASMLIALFALATIGALMVLADSAMRGMATWRALGAVDVARPAVRAVRVRFSEPMSTVSAQVVPLVRTRVSPATITQDWALRAAA